MARNAVVDGEDLDVEDLVVVMVAAMVVVMAVLEEAGVEDFEEVAVADMLLIRAQPVSYPLVG